MSATFVDSVAAELAAFLRTRREVVRELVRRAEQLAAIVQARPTPYVLCHVDIHAANVLIDTSQHLYIVDWDTLMLAPKERDLMLVGGGQYGQQRSPQEEVALFDQGYGATEPDRNLLAYYGYERIVQDIDAYCEQILFTDEGGPDRAEGLRRLTGQFLPGQVIDITFRLDDNWYESL